MITTQTISSFNAAATRPSINVLARASRCQTRRTNPRLIPVYAHAQLTPFSSSASPSAKTDRPSNSTSTSTNTTTHAQHHLTFLSPDTADSSESVNPAPTTRPPPLELPEKPAQPGLGYYFSLGKAYVTFYKTGLKNVWTNYKLMSAPVAAHGDLLRILPPVPVSVPEVPLPKFPSGLSRSRELGQQASDIRLKEGHDASKKFIRAAVDKENKVRMKAREANEKENEDLGPRWRARAREIHDLAVRRLTRAEVQLVRRTKRDVWRLVPFLAVLAVFWEFTPFVVALGLVRPPGTCALAWQRELIRKKKVIDKEVWCDEFKRDVGEGLVNMVAPPERLVKEIRRADHFEASAACDILGVRVWFWEDDYVKLIDRMRYLLLDDALIVKGGGVSKMNKEEVALAVWERGGVEVGFGLSPEEAEYDQRWWLERWIEGSKKVVM